MSQYAFFYTDTEADALVASTDPLEGDHLVSMTVRDYDREVRVRENRVARAAEEALAERETKRAELASKLGITVEDLSLLG